MTFKPNIKNKLLCGVAVMLLPILLIACMAFYALQRNTETYEKMIGEVIDEIPRIGKVKGLILMAQMPPNDYLISANKTEQNTFGYFVEQINEALFELKNAPFSHQQEILLAGLAEDNWREGITFAQQLFAVKNPKTDQRGEELLEEFDAHLGKAVSLLNQLELRTYQEIEEDKQTAKTWIYSLYLVIGFSLAGGLAIASMAGLLLARMVLRPLKELSNRAEMIGRGEHPEPIILKNHDEFSQVMDVFNSMALNLKQNQADLKNMATRDGLTGLLNRREIRRLLGQELDRAKRRFSEMSVMMLDIDHFKNVNDTHGHQIGDEVLKGVATLLGQQIRTMDTVARYGGEEFIIITPESSDGALHIAERILAAVAGQPYSDGKGGSFNLTISIGLASYPKHAVEEYELVNKADMALYQAKELGRNQVCLASSPPLQKSHSNVIPIDKSSPTRQ